MQLSRNYEKRAQQLIWLLSVGILISFGSIYYIEKDSLGPIRLLIWLLAVTAIFLPLFVRYLALQTRRYECLTLAYGFQRKAIVEERLFRYAGENGQLRDELLKVYLVHWMEKSPLEVMLAIGGKSKNMSEISLKRR